MHAQSEEIYEVCKVTERIFVLHPKFARANFYSQQLRVLALVEALERKKHLAAGGRNCAIVGRGIAGLTAAAALLTRGAPVVTIDRNDAPMADYARVIHREIHPNIILWPFQKLRSMTDLPFLNWSINTASGVRSDVVRQWDESFRAFVPAVTGEVENIRDNGRVALITLKSGEIIEKNLVVVACGWKLEDPAEAINLTRYWSARDFERGATVTISGTGDGGLIDAATQFFGPNAVAAARTLAYALEDSPAREEIIAAEGSAAALLIAGKRDQAFERLNQYYGTLHLEPRVTEAVTFPPNEHISVRVIFDRPSPYSPTVAPINKVMIAYCKQRFPSSISIEPGSLTIVPPYTAGVLTTAAGGTSDVSADGLLIRHGAGHAAYDMFVSPERDRLDVNERSHAETLLNVLEDRYDERLFKTKPKRKLVKTAADGKAFFQEVAQRAEQMMTYLKHPARAQPVKSPASRRSLHGGKNAKALWKIELRVIGALPAHLRPIFPLKAQGVNIALSESDRLRFSSRSAR